MSKYHINDAGNPGICRAKNFCPFGSDERHYPTKEDAQKAFELLQKLNAIPTISKLSEADKAARQAATKAQADAVRSSRLSKVHKRYGEIPKNGNQWTDEVEIRDRMEAQLERSKESSGDAHWRVTARFVEDKEKSLDNSRHQLIRSHAYSQQVSNTAFKYYKDSLKEYTFAQVAAHLEDKRLSTRSIDDMGNIISQRKTHLASIAAIESARSAEMNSVKKDLQIALNITDSQMDDVLGSAEHWFLSKKNSKVTLQEMASNPARFTVFNKLSAHDQENAKEILNYAAQFTRY